MNAPYLYFFVLEFNLVEKKCPNAHSHNHVPANFVLDFINCCGFCVVHDLNYTLMLKWSHHFPSEVRNV